MKGKYKIIVQNKKLRYDLEIKRNITIIKGDSATGKTTLIDMLRSYNNLGNSSGINVFCDVPCRVLEGSDWKLVLSNTSGVIFFTDEENAFIRSKEFAEAVSGSDNYYVLVTRENLYELPYSVDEIYGISSSGRYQKMKQVYQQMYHIYSQEDNLPISTDGLLIEDEGSGFDFYKAVCD